MAVVSASSYFFLLAGTLESTKTLGIMAGAAVLAAGMAGLLVFPAVLGRLAPEVSFGDSSQSGAHIKIR